MSTPEAVHNISRSVHLASQRTAKPISKPSFIPVPKAPVASAPASSQLTSTMGGDHLNISDDSSGSLTKLTLAQNSKVASRALSSQKWTPVARPKDTSSNATTRAVSSQQRTPVARPKDTSSNATTRAVSSEQRTPVARPKDTSSNATTRAVSSQRWTAVAQPKDTSSQVASRVVSSQQRTRMAQPKDTSSKVIGKAMRSHQGTPVAKSKEAGSISVGTPLMDSMPRAVDLLADQVRATSVKHLLLFVHGNVVI